MIKIYLISFLLVTSLYSNEKTNEEIVPYKMYENFVTEASKQSYLKGRDAGDIFRETVKASHSAGKSTGKSTRKLFDSFFK